MAGRIIFELFIFSIPFIVFGLYLLATSSAEQEGRRKWPINMLFLIGIGLATITWFVLILMEPKQRDICHEPARFENGKITPARDYPCDPHVENVGLPGERSDVRPANGATGETTGMHDASEIGARPPGDDPGAEAELPEAMQPDDDGN
ncbi:DUF6111 family protein [Hyphomonas pacifica]|uniref:Uncharacterized protein n=1 Tax=Hyphomonas pacifica TaxID=1280941 RepID=A0A062U5N5_9PROT|nr:DUF6111 family protein [Hyphomonas pacifica]KCZ53058.1 hypothetical protein HY2_00605 [Hyphomonas pacifica]RAN36083.1 hypothetical protein HY3_00465 [Hyphomonas pacifica]